MTPTPTPTRRRTRPRGAFLLIDAIFSMAGMAILATVGIGAAVAFVFLVKDVDADETLKQVGQAELHAAGQYGQFTTSTMDLPELPNGLTLTTGPSSSSDEVSASVGTQGTLALALRHGDKCSLVRVSPPLDGGQILTVTDRQSPTCTAADAFEDEESPLPTQPTNLADR